MKLTKCKKWVVWDVSLQSYPKGGITVRRVLEPELMDERQQAEAYAASDFTEPHDAFVRRFSEAFPGFSDGHVADLCCGPADPTIRFARRYPNAYIVGYDGAESMLALGRKAVESAGLSNRIWLRCEMLPISAAPEGVHFTAIMCNGSMHHLQHSGILWQSVKNIGSRGTVVFVVDLTRPSTVDDAEMMVQQCTKPTDPALMKRDFYNSLLAAFRPEEVRVDLDAAGLGHFRVEVVTHRHMMIYGRLP
ncbi:MAG: class I SAM-dependent methyltransferase [bacterium]|nr:class I SAM-dependent methyltransferase [bacterium]